MGSTYGFGQNLFMIFLHFVGWMIIYSPHVFSFFHRGGALVAPSHISPATTPPRCNVNRLPPLTPSDIPVFEPLGLSIPVTRGRRCVLLRRMGCAPCSPCKVIPQFPIRFTTGPSYFPLIFSSSIHGVHVVSNVRLSGSNNNSRQHIGNRSRMHQGIQEPTLGGELRLHLRDQRGG